MLTTCEPISGGFADQVRQTFANLSAILEAAGSSLSHIVKVNAYLTDPDQLGPFNEVYREILGHAPPARTTVCVQLWGVSLEIALKPGDALVIDMAGDHAHACAGAVTQLAARSAGAVGIIVDGVVTDLNELQACQLNVPVHCAGVEVQPGDIVLADDNGVLILPATELTSVIDKALQSDLAEPELMARLRNGEPLQDVITTRIDNS
ncbi:Rid family hydrolase [Pseudomonas sp. NPDC089422]|uniref:Rid family hydrolase n=1 Tax=Pseudomonas sp. NPDC089422 TaxID=3364466 RepID=UPI0038254BF2